MTGCFYKLEFLARVLRRNNQPFGGIQLVLSGDFCQLPPVPDRDNKGIHKVAIFAFDATSWSKCIDRPVVLHRVFRQKDQGFVDMLNAMRLGHLSPDAIEKFRKLSRPVIYDDGIEPTDLSVSSFCRWLYAHLSVRYHLSFPTRREVDNANGLRLNRLPGPERRYDAADVGGVDFAGMPLPQFKV